MLQVGKFYKKGIFYYYLSSKDYDIWDKESPYFGGTCVTDGLNTISSAEQFFNLEGLQEISKEDFLEVFHKAKNAIDNSIKMIN